MHYVIIDTDPGIDDAQAIAFAIAHPEIELLGLTTVFGNADVDTTTANALIVLDEFGRPDIPVAKGASQPLEQARFASPEFVHGVDGLGNLNLSKPKTQAVTETAAEFIVRSANELNGELTLVAVGPLTNIAQAVSLDPSLPSKVKQLVVMGGCVTEPGNVTPIAEANFINDPHAADQVLAYDWPVTIIGLDVTNQTKLSEADLARLRDNAGRTGQFLWDSGQFYLDFYARRFSDQSQRTCAMHDASAVIYAVMPGAFDSERGPARVITSGLALGQLALDRRGESYLFPDWEERPKITAAMRVDSAKVLNTFLTTIEEYFSV